MAVNCISQSCALLLWVKSGGQTAYEDPALQKVGVNWSLDPVAPRLLTLKRYCSKL